MLTKYGVWGGTTHIGVKSATNALHAARFAADIGQPFTTLVTINWHRLGIDNESAMAAFSQLRSKVRRRWKYLRDQGTVAGNLEGVASHENPASKRNTHWMVAVSETCLPEFERTTAKFLAKLVGTKNLGAALLIKRLYAVGGAMKYALKGVDPAYQRYFMIEPEDQGFIAGRGRTFVSRDIGLAARKRAGWVRRRRPHPPGRLGR